MTPELILLIIAALLLIIIAVTLLTKKTANNDHKFDAITTEIQRIENAVRTEIAANRKETFEQSAQARKELAQSLASFEEKLNHLTNTIDAGA